MNPLHPFILWILVQTMINTSTYYPVRHPREGCAGAVRLPNLVRDEGVCPRSPLAFHGFDDTPTICGGRLEQLDPVLLLLLTISYIIAFENNSGHSHIQYIVLRKWIWTISNSRHARQEVEALEGDFFWYDYNFSYFWNFESWFF